MNMLNEFYVNNTGKRAKLMMSFSCVKLLNLKPDLYVFLNHFWVMFLFYASWKYQKTFTFFDFYCFQGV